MANVIHLKGLILGSAGKGAPLQITSNPIRAVHLIIFNRKTGSCHCGFKM